MTAPDETAFKNGSRIMKKKTLAIACLIGIVGAVFVWTQAGQMEPSGRPAPTMVSLQDLYDALLTAVWPGALQTTGQWECWGVDGGTIDCAGTGQDGEYRTGVSVSPRFDDRDNGTVRDLLTGLLWLKEANCFWAPTWHESLAHANGLAHGSCGLTDGSSAGDWRIPNVRELHSLIDYGKFAPALPAGGHPFTWFSDYCMSGDYWTSTTGNLAPKAWTVNIRFGTVNMEEKSSEACLWLVRGGT
jgi:hypothetical protein